MNAKLARLLADIFNIRVSEMNESLQQRDIARWDSLTHMDLITSLEREYDVELSMEDIMGMTSIAKIIAVLQSYEIGINV